MTEASHPTAKQLRVKEQESMNNFVMWEGAKAGLLGLGLSLAGSFVAQRKSALYKNLSTPFKVFLVMSATTASFFTVADRAVMIADRKFAQQFSISKEVLPQSLPESRLDLDSIKNWGFRNRFHIVGYGWLSCAAGTLLYQWKRKDIAVSQKIINARLSSQLLALVGVFAIAALTASLPVEKKMDPHFEAIVNGASEAE